MAKLGLKPGLRVQLLSPPNEFAKTLGPMPEGVRQVARGALDFAMLFVRARQTLEKQFPKLRDRLVANGMLWVSWPKKASGVDTDLNETIVRSIGLEAGLVDVKICAVDEIWSGLKFVRRLKDR